ncbi:MAG: hypothetical protein SNJ52_01205 [Verrucomicrobiia bacterium]
MKSADKTYMMMVDGELSPSQVSAHLLKTTSRDSREHWAAEWRLIGEALRRGTPVPRQAPDASFNAQVLAQIRTGNLRSEREGSRDPGLRLRDLALIGCACLIFAFGIMLSVSPGRQHHQLTEVTSLRVPDANLSATPIGREQRVTILWTTGLDFVADHEFRLNSSP